MKCIRMVLYITLLSLLLSACGDSGGSHHDSWESATLIAENARNPQLVSDGKGNPIAVWTGLDGIFFNRFNSWSGWGEPLKIAGLGPLAIYPIIALSKNGQFAAIAYESAESGSYHYEIKICDFKAGTGWSLIGNLAGMCFMDDMAIDNEGNLFLTKLDTTWINIIGMEYATLRLYRYNKTDGWRDDQIDTGDWQLFEIERGSRIAMDDSGNGFVIWSEYYSSNNHKLFVRRFSLGAIGAPLQLAETSDMGFDWINVAMDNQGNAMALWGQEDSSSIFHTYACRYTPAGGWGAALKVDESSFSTIDQCLTVDHAGNFHVVWTQRMESFMSDIFYCAYNPVNGWQRPQKIGTGGNGRYPRIAADSAGNLYATWLQYDLNSQSPGDGKIYVNQSRAHSGWGSQTKLQQAPGDSSPPVLAVYRPGEAMVVWSQTTGSVDGILSYGIFSSRFR